MSRRTGRIVLALASALVALGAAEVIFRVERAASDEPGSDDGWRQRYRRMNETLYRRSHDPELVYEPVPSSAVEMEYGVAAFNSAGMRDDREHALAAPRPRVTLLGDSLVWSEFIALEGSLARRTEEALGDDWDVLAFGVTGYDTTQEARWYERGARAYEADVVALVWCMNDMMIMSGPFERFANEADRARKDAQEAMVAREAPVRRETIDSVLEERERDAPVKVVARALGLFEHWRFASRYTDEYLVSFRDRARRRATRAALHRLGRAIRREGAAPVLVISPVLESWDDYHWRPIHRFVESAGEAAGFTVIDPLDEWRRAHSPSELRISGDNLHYDGGGLELLGRTVADAVRRARPAR